MSMFLACFGRHAHAAEGAAAGAHMEACLMSAACCGPKASTYAQVHTLLKGLEKIAASADIPMLVAGDFNSTPGSAAHALLVKRAVDPSHPVGAP